VAKGVLVLTGVGVELGKIGGLVDVVVGIGSTTVGVFAGDSVAVAVGRAIELVQPTARIIEIRTAISVMIRLIFRSLQLAYNLAEILLTRSRNKHNTCSIHNSGFARFTT
jgi:hypothetical protein